MNPWKLPETAVIGGVEYEVNTDYRDVLDVLAVLNNPDDSEYMRWLTAIALFYVGEIPPENEQEAMEYLAEFIAYAEKDAAAPGPVLVDWEQDAQAIVADVNKVAGMEIRALPYLHWWTFLSYFQAIGEGQLSMRVSIRDKLRRGKKLESWEQEFYRENKKSIEIAKRYSEDELREQERLNRLLEQ